MNWKPVVQFEGLYEINENGDIRNISLNQGRKRGYLNRHLTKSTRSNILQRQYYKLRKNEKNHTVFVHRALAMAFIPNPKNYPEVNHIDGNPLNNSLKNLEWVSKKTNIQHAFANKLIKTEKPVLQFTRDGSFIAEYPSESMGCRSIGVSQGKIGRAIRRKGLCKGFKWEYKVNV